MISICALVEIWVVAGDEIFGEVTCMCIEDDLLGKIEAGGGNSTKNINTYFY